MIYAEIIINYLVTVHKVESNENMNIFVALNEEEATVK